MHFFVQYLNTIVLFGLYILSKTSEPLNVCKTFHQEVTRTKNVPYSHRLTILNQLMLQSHRSQSDLICLFQILNNFTNANLKSCFNVSPNITSGTHSLWGNAFTIDIPKPRTDPLKFNFFYTVIKCWNSLPTFVSDTPFFAVFKKKLSEYMINHVIWFFCFCLCVGIRVLLYGLYLVCTLLSFL